MGQAENKRREPMTLDNAQITQVEALAPYLTTQQIADHLGIGRTTFYRIMERQPEVEECYKRGKTDTVRMVADTLIKKALSGNVLACIFYLKTQGGWREKTENDDAADKPPAPLTPEGFSAVKTHVYGLDA